MEQSLFDKLIITQLVKKFPAFYGNPAVHYGFHKSLSLVSVLSQMGPVHVFSPHFPKINFDILPSTSRSAKWFIPFKFFCNQSCVRYSPPWSDHNNTCWWKQIM